ncbi:uncharacterized protein [Coffea arabica]|uniref:Transcription termination factor MTERF15, mitochondrial-like n=1 Tax=Coffea arabica TaxID=13443 RepID=A0ABM4U0U3_COFAR
MWSAYLFRKHFSIRSLAKKTIPCFTLLQKSRLLSNPVGPRMFDNQCSINYSSLVEAIDSGYGLKTRNKNGGKSDSFTVSYLVNSCGLSEEKAFLLSKRVKFESPEKPNAVLTFLRDQGFSSIHITRIVISAPKILLYNPEKTLLPKIEFFRSMWVSRTDLTNYLSANHHLLTYSLKNTILPMFNCFKSIFLTDARIASAAMWRNAFFCKNPIKNLTSNIAMLRELGVPEKHIRMSLAHFSLAMMQDNDQFAEALSQVEEMGFDPSKSMFMIALLARSGKGNRSRWARNYEIYSSWGWSEDEIRSAYRGQPFCMLVSEKKLTKLMDFMVNKMGWNSQVVARYPHLVTLSVEKRIIPRGSVIHLLHSKGLIKKNLSLYSIFSVREKNFLRNFVTLYEEQVPELRGVYQGKIGILDV